MPKISIIIPCYKVEQYLPKCLTSIQAQTFQDWEAICIDDGSPDNTGKILDDYAKKDSRIKVIHQENGGVSSARNRGLDIAIGEYIAFIDPDDWIATDYYQTLLNAIEDHNADVVQCAFTYVNGDNFEKVEWEKQVANSFIDIVNGLRKGYIWNKLWKAKIFQTNNIRFDTNTRCCEDLLFSIMASVYINKFVNVAYSGYFYRYNMFSALNDPQLKQRNDRDCQTVCRKAIKFVENKSKKEIDAVKTFLVSQAYNPRLLKDKKVYKEAKEIFGYNALLIKFRYKAIKKNVFRFSLRKKEITLFGKTYTWIKN